MHKENENEKIKKIKTWLQATKVRKTSTASMSPKILHLEIRGKWSFSFTIAFMLFHVSFY